MPRALCLLPGMEGEDVREAQRALAALGHAVPDTGAFDAATKSALIAWLSTVQPEREAPAAGARAQVPRGDTFAGLCTAKRITDWTDLWEDQGPGLDDNADLPGDRSFLVPSRAERRRGHDLLEATGRDTAPAYGGLAYVPPVERLSRTIVFEDGTAIDAPAWLRVEAPGAGAHFEDGRLTGSRPRGAAVRVELREIATATGGH
jgi:hypothetical protein